MKEKQLKLTGILVLIFIVIFSRNLKAEMLKVEYCKYYDGGNDDAAYAVAVDSNNNIIATGYSNNDSNIDAVTIKYDSDLNIINSARYNGETEYKDAKAYGVAVDKDNNIITTGCIWHYYSWLCYTIKYDSNLNKTKSATYENLYYIDDRARAVVVDKDNNIINIGKKRGETSGWDYYIIKYNSSNLNMIDSATYSSKNDDCPYGIAVDKDNNIIVTGYSNNGVNNDYYTIKYNSDLKEIASARYDGGNDDRAQGATIDTNNNIIVTGYSNNGVNNDYYTIKYNSDLKEIASARYDGGNDDRAQGATIDTNNNIIVTGYSNNGVNNDYYTIKYNSDLTAILSSATHDAGGDDRAYAVTMGKNKNIIVTGKSGNDFCTIKYKVSIH